MCVTVDALPPSAAGRAVQIPSLQEIKLAAQGVALSLRVAIAE